MNFWGTTSLFIKLDIYARLRKAFFVGGGVYFKKPNAD
jgi:hypothetical protein